jgi:hypothetical protein
MTEPTENWFVAPDEVREIVRAELRAFADEVLAEAIGTSIGEIAKEIEAHLRDALREFTYKGSWSEGVTYRKGNFRQHGRAAVPPKPRRHLAPRHERRLVAGGQERARRARRQGRGRRIAAIRSTSGEVVQMITASEVKMNMERQLLDLAHGRPLAIRGVHSVVEEGGTVSVGFDVTTLNDGADDLWFFEFELPVELLKRAELRDFADWLATPTLVEHLH